MFVTSSNILIDTNDIWKHRDGYFRIVESHQQPFQCHEKKIIVREVTNYKNFLNNSICLLCDLFNEKKTAGV